VVVFLWQGAGWRTWLALLRDGEVGQTPKPLAVRRRRRASPERVVGRRVVAAIAGIGVQTLDSIADQLFDRRGDLCERVAVVRIARQRLGMDGELAALAALEGGGDADLTIPPENAAPQRCATSMVGRLSLTPTDR
jgi:hypothetical protein